MPRGRHAPAPLPTVPFTRDGLDCLHELALRFKALGRPLPDHLIVELAIRKLYHEYCLYANDIQVSDPDSVKIMKRSKDVLDARYREFVVEGQRRPRQAFARPAPAPANSSPSDLPPAP